MNFSRLLRTIRRFILCDAFLLCASIYMPFNFSSFSFFFLVGFIIFFLHCLFFSSKIPIGKTMQIYYSHCAFRCRVFLMAAKKHLYFHSVDIRYHIFQCFAMDVSRCPSFLAMTNYALCTSINTLGRKMNFF